MSSNWFKLLVSGLPLIYRDKCYQSLVHAIPRTNIQDWCDETFIQQVSVCLRW